MFLELAEILDCPVCRSGFGLVTFVDDAAERRVLTGRLGCPMCEVEYPIREGAIELADPAPAEDLVLPEDLPLRLAALLGLAEGGPRVVLMGPGLANAAPDVARQVERIEILTWNASSDAEEASADELALGWNPLRGQPSDRWPIRDGVLHGVALAGPSQGLLAEAHRCLRPEGRLVCLQLPEAEMGSATEVGFRELAADGDTWVGERPD